MHNATSLMFLWCCIQLRRKKTHQIKQAGYGSMMEDVWSSLLEILFTVYDKKKTTMREPKQTIQQDHVLEHSLPGYLKS